MFHPKINRLWITLVILTLSSCGFHLRQPKPFPPALQTLYLRSGAPYSDLTIQVKQLLGSMHIQLVPTQHDAPITLFIFDESYTQSTASESASSKTKQYRMRFHVEYQLQDANGLVIYGPKVISTSRIYTVEEDQVLSSNTQGDILQKEMQQDAAYQIITELSSPNVFSAVNHYENKTRATTTATQ